MKFFSAFFWRGRVDRSWARTQKVVRSKNSPGKAPNTKSGSCGTCQMWQLGRSGLESTETAHEVGPAGRSRLGERAGACEKIRRARLSSGPREVAWRRGRFFGSLGAPTRADRPRSRPMRPRAALPGSHVRGVPWRRRPCPLALRGSTGRAAQLLLRAAEVYRSTAGAGGADSVLAARWQPQRWRARLRGRWVGQTNSRAPPPAASRAAPSSGCAPPCRSRARCTVSMVILRGTQRPSCLVRRSEPVARVRSGCEPNGKSSSSQSRALAQHLYRALLLTTVRRRLHSERTLAARPGVNERSNERCTVQPTDPDRRSRTFVATAATSDDDLTAVSRRQRIRRDNLLREVPNLVSLCVGPPNEGERCDL